MSAKEPRFRSVGRVIGRMAYDRDLTGSYVLADYLRKWAQETGYEGRVPARNTVSEYITGKVYPSADFIHLFAMAVKLTQAEKQELAWVHTYPFWVIAAREPAA